MPRSRVFPPLAGCCTHYCANDYGFEKAMEEWLKVHFQNDLLVAISSPATAQYSQPPGKLGEINGRKPDYTFDSRQTIH
jgi:hypothetical protein